MRQGVPITERAWKKFLTTLEDSGQVMFSLKKARIGYASLTRRKRNDPEFREKYEIAVVSSGEKLERIAENRAVNGYFITTYDGDGNIIKKEHKYSDNLLLQLIRSRDPNHTGVGKFELTQNFNFSNDDLVKKLDEELSKSVKSMEVLDEPNET